MKIYPKRLLKKLHWQDYRTLKKHLEILKVNKFIKYNFSQIPINSTIEIKINYIEDFFTQVDMETINKIVDCTLESKMFEQALRLFYYYEKNYNKDYGRSFPGYEKISQETKIRKGNIKPINDIFNNNKLVKVQPGLWYEDEFGCARKTNNNYIPMCKRK